MAGTPTSVASKNLFELQDTFSACKAELFQIFLAKI